MGAATNMVLSLGGGSAGTPSAIGARVTLGAGTPSAIGAHVTLGAGTPSAIGARVTLGVASTPNSRVMPTR